MRTWPFLQNAMVFPLSRLAARMRAIGGGLHNGAYRKRGEESHAHRPDRDIALAHAVLFRPCAGDEGRDDRRCERPRRRARGAARRPGEMPRLHLSREPELEPPSSGGYARPSTQPRSNQRYFGPNTSMATRPALTAQGQPA